MNSWATIEDIKDRFGEEYLDKKSIRNYWDNTTQSYIADESEEGKEKVQLLALQDAKELILAKLNSKFKNVNKVNDYYFYSIKQWHIKWTISILGNGGDCTGCDCEKDFKDFLNEKICTSDGICLESISNFSVLGTEEFNCGCGFKC